MRITCRRLRLAVPEQAADQRQGQPAGDRDADAKECRKSCSRTSSRSAAFRTRSQAFPRLTRCSPGLPPQMMYGLPSSRGKPASTSSAGGFRWMIFLPVLLSGSARVPSLQVYPLPARLKDFASPRADEEQQADRPGRPGVIAPHRSAASSARPSRYSSLGLRNRSRGCSLYFSTRRNGLPCSGRKPWPSAQAHIAPSARSTQLA